MSADGLTPMLLMVCARCREGEGGECHWPGCSFWMHRMDTVPIEPTRTREEMVEAILVARYGYARPWPGRRESIVRDLLAAGVISEMPDHPAPSVQ